MNALQLLNQFPENKSQLKTFVASFVEAAKNGYNEPLEVLKKIKILEEILKQSKSELSELFQDECDKYHEKTFDAHGCSFQKREIAKYDFSSDSEWIELNNTKKTIEQDIKDREAFLRTIKEPVADTKTGEIINPIAKKIQSSIAVILK